MAFRGIHLLVLDTKGRMALPKRYRDAVSLSQLQSWVLTIDTEATCLLLYPLLEWEGIEAQLQALPSFDPAARRIQRLLIGHASELELDTQGRLLLPLLLREYAKLDKKIMLVGQGRKFELWDADQWEEQRTFWLSEETEKTSRSAVLQSLAL